MKYLVYTSIYTSKLHHTICKYKYLVQIQIPCIRISYYSSLPNDSAAVLLAHISYHVEVGSPKLEFALPVDNGRERRGDEERAFRVAFLVERVEKRDRLNGFPEAHLVRKDCICVIAPRKAQPVKAFELIRMELPTCGRNEFWLRFVGFGQLNNNIRKLM